MSNQLKYILKRIVYSVITIFLLIAITFTLMHMLPGNPFSGGKAIPEATMEALNAKYGLDKPIMEQFFIYIGNVLRGDLGVSVPDGRQITDIIAQAFPVSLELGVELIFAFIMGILLGVLAAIKRGTVWDSASYVLCINRCIRTFLYHWFPFAVFSGTEVVSGDRYTGFCYYGLERRKCKNFTGIRSCFWFHGDHQPFDENQYAGRFGTGLH